MPSVFLNDVEKVLEVVPLQPRGSRARSSSWRAWSTSISVIRCASAKASLRRRASVRLSRSRSSFSTRRAAASTRRYCVSTADREGLLEALEVAHGVEDVTVRLPEVLEHDVLARAAEERERHEQVEERRGRLRRGVGDGLRKSPPA